MSMAFTGSIWSSTRFLVVCLIFQAHCIRAQVHPHVNAHAHNDYEHERPLHDALENGFTSIEADIHLVDGELMVSHNRPGPTARSLSSLYLDPIDSLITHRGGHLYTGFGRPITLLIDIKTDAATTYYALKSVLEGYRSWLHTSGKQGVVQVVISGNRATDLILADNDRLVAIDGRPGDLNKGYTPDEVPLISESYGKVLKWNGRGKPSAADLIALNQLIATAHREGKRIRLWGAPDNENTWAILLNAGVDLINTDNLLLLNKFLSARGR
jgi:glycerophosphoryl diester phosphodiesterase